MTKPRHWVYLGLVVLVILVYGQVVRHEFVNWDDNDYVYENQHVLNGLTWAGVRWAVTSSHVGFWQPLTWLSLMLDAQVYGQNAGGFHFTNLLFHAVNVLLLLTVLRHMTGALWPSAMVAALFAVHPLHVESVAWVTERKDVLSTTFWMLTLLAYTSYARRGGLGRYVLVALFLALGLMAKPMLVTLPCVLLLLDFWPLGRLNFGQKLPDHHPTPSPFSLVLLEKLPFIALSAVAGAITTLNHRDGGALATLDSLSVTMRFAHAAIAYISYLGKMIWPSNLACFYLHPAFDSVDEREIPYIAALAAGSLLTLITGLAIYFFRRYPYLTVGWFWYLGALAPVIGLMQAGMQSMADRFTYVPLVGIYILIAWSASDQVRHRSSGRIVAIASSVTILGALAFTACFQAGTWRNSLALFEHAARVTPNFIMLNHRGSLYAQSGKHEAALMDFARAIEMMPSYADTYYNQGNSYRQLGKHQLALASYDQAIKLNPLYKVAYTSRGKIYALAGKPDLALADYTTAIEITQDSDAIASRGIIYAQLGRNELALADFTKAIELKPDLAVVYSNRGALYAKTGQYETALSDFARAIELKPQDARPYTNAATLLATCPDANYRNAQAAIDYARRACQLLDWRDFRSLATLAAAHAEAGDFTEAIHWQTKAMNLAPANAQVHLRSRLALFQAGKPYRQGSE